MIFLCFYFITEILIWEINDKKEKRKMSVSVKNQVILKKKKQLNTSLVSNS